MNSNEISTALEDNRKQAQPVKTEYHKDEYTGAGATDDVQLLVKSGVTVKRNVIVVKDSNKQFVLPDSTILATIGDKLGEATYGCVKHLSKSSTGVYATISDNRKPFFCQIDNPDVATFNVGDVVGVTETGTIKTKYSTTGSEKLKCIVLDEDDDAGINRSTGLIYVKFVTASSASSSDYNSYFKVVEIKNGNNVEYWVVDGADTNSAYAGYLQVGSQNIHCLKEKFGSVSGAGSFYVRLFWDEDLEEYDYEYKFATTIPSVDQEVNTELSTITNPVSPATVGVLTQRWTSGAINNINGVYVT